MSYARMLAIIAIAATNVAAFSIQSVPSHTGRFLFYRNHVYNRYPISVVHRDDTLRSVASNYQNNRAILMAKRRRKKSEEDDPDDMLLDDYGDSLYDDDGEADDNEDSPDKSGLAEMEQLSSEYVNFPSDDGIEPAKIYTGPSWTEMLTNSYLAVCFDKDEDNVFESLRTPNMINHVVWARRSTRIPDAKARVIFSRALLNADLQCTIGSLIGIAAASQRDAEILLADEPYNGAGLFKFSQLYSWPRSSLPELSYNFKPYPYAVVAMDKKGAFPLRKKTRKAHLDYLQSLESVVGAGPIIPLSKDDDSSNDPIGSVVFFNADNSEFADLIVKNDPYALAGVFETVSVHALCDIDVEGTSLVKALIVDPVRDILEKEGLTTEEDYPKIYEDIPALNIKADK